LEAAERVRQQRLQEQKALELEIEQARYEVRRAAIRIEPSNENSAGDGL